MADEDYLLEYHQDAEEPPTYMWLRGADGELVDMSGATFTFYIGKRGQTPLVTKIDGITGAVGEGEPPDGVPNVAIIWEVGEIAQTNPGEYRWWLYCRGTPLRDRIYEGLWRTLKVPVPAS